MIDHRKKFPFEISGLTDQRGRTGMEAIYADGWFNGNEEEENDMPSPQYHPNVLPCYQKNSGMSRTHRPCPCQENGWGVVLPDQETQYWMNMYPEKMSRVQRKVEEECDKMDYEGSIMYDEFPDRVLLKRISRNIYELLLEDDLLSEGEVIDTDAREVESEEENLKETGLFSPKPERPPKPPTGPGRPPMNPGSPGRPGGPGRPPMGPGPVRPPMRPGCPSGRCKRKDSWLKEAVDVLLFEEMHRRRRNRYR